MLPLLPTKVLDLTQMSQEELNSRMEDLAVQVIPSWTDHSLNYPENVIKENVALLTSMAVETMNERFRQLSMAQVTDRLAVIRAGRPHGYELMSATAAELSGKVKLTASALASKVIPIPEGTRWSSVDGDIFSSTAAAQILVGQNASGIFTVKNWESQEDIYISEETPNFIIKLSKKDFVEGSLSVVAANGTYSLLDGEGKAYRSFLEMSPSILGMLAFADDNGYIYVFFGDGITGAIPRGTITVQYKTGGGKIGRIEAGAVWKNLDTIYDVDGSPVSVVFENTTDSSGGYDATTVEEARVKLPLAIRTRERSVNESDFERTALEVAGVATAALMTSNHDTSIAEDRAILYLVSYGTPYSDDEGGGYYPPTSPTSDQISAVQALIAKNGQFEKLMGGVVSVQTAIFLDVDVSVRVRRASGWTGPQVKTSIEKELRKFFAVANEVRVLQEKIDFGYRLVDADGNPDYKLTWSDIFNAVRDAEGVREITYDSSNLLLNGLHQSVFLEPKEFPRLASIYIYDMGNGGVLL